MTTIENEPFVIDKLSQLKNIPPRNMEKAASTKARYLSEMKDLASIISVAGPVSISPRERLNEWIKNIRNLSLRKEHSPMLTTLATMITVLVLAFGGAGATVFAAQDSLPNDLLYPVKTASEEFRMAISTETQTQFQLSLEFANRRMGEIAALASDGQVIPQEVMTQMQLELNNAFQLAAGMSEEELEPALLKIQATIQQQQQTMAGLASGLNDPLITRLRLMLQEREQLCNLGLTDPLMFRLQLRQRQNSEQTPPTGQPTGAGSGNSQGNQGQGTGVLNGGNSGTNTGTGTGSGTCTDCVPVLDGTGPGPGPDAGNGEGSDDSTPPQDGTGVSEGPNEDPGSGGNTNTDPGNGNDNQNEQEETNNDNNNSDNENSNNENSNNENSSTNNPSTPGTGGSEDSGGGKGKP